MKEKKKLILIGAGGHCNSCIDVIESMGQYKIAGLVEKDKTLNDENLGYPIIGTDSDLDELRKEYSLALITVGQIKSSEIRVKLFHLLKKLNFTLPIIISPNAYVSKYAQVGEGSIILHNSTINANAKKFVRRSGGRIG